MLRRSLSLRGLAPVALALLAPRAPAQFAPASSFHRAQITVHTTGAAARTVGWQFRALDDLEVTAIGVFDSELQGAPQGGLASPKAVGLFDMSHQLLAAATVPAGQGGLLCQDGFRYVAVPPTSLQAGAEYVIAAFWPTDDGSDNFDDFPDVENSGNPVAFHAGIEFVQTRYALGAGGLVFPSGALPGLRSYLGALTFRIGAGECEENPPADLATTFASDNGFAGAMFDLRALHPEGLTVEAFQVNLGDVVPQDQAIGVQVWWRHGSYADAVATSAGWHLLGSARVRSWGTNQPTPVPVGGLVLPAGEVRGVYVCLEEYTEHPPAANVPLLHYTAIGPAAASYVTAELELTGGVGKGPPAFTGSTFPARMWNGGVLVSIGGDPFEAYCAGDGSAAACPCGNPGAAGEGCAHGGGIGAILAASGTSSIAAGGPVLSASQVPPASVVLFFQGENRTADGQGLAFADGLRCAGGGVLRLELALADGAGAADTSVDLAAAGALEPGDTRHYQAWFRDPAASPCGAGSNLSGALTVAWSP